MPIENGSVPDFSAQQSSPHINSESACNMSGQSLTAQSLRPRSHTFTRRQALFLIGATLGAIGGLDVESRESYAAPKRQLGGGGSESTPNPHDTSVPNIPLLEFGEDPLSSERLAMLRKFVYPPLFAEEYIGKDRNGVRERQAKELRNQILAAGMAVEAGGLARAAEDLNRWTSLQLDPNDNLTGGFIRVHTFGQSGNAKVGMLAHPSDETFCSSYPCPPTDPVQPISIFRLVPKETRDPDVTFSLIHGVVIGKPHNEFNPKDLAMLTESILITRESIVVGNRIMETEYKQKNILDINRMVADEYSPYNMDVKTEALFNAFSSALELRSAFPNYWYIFPGFASNLAQFEEALKSGENDAKNYTRYLADRRNNR